VSCVLCPVVRLSWARQTTRKGTTDTEREGGRGRRWGGKEGTQGEGEAPLLSSPRRQGNRDARQRRVAGWLRGKRATLASRGERTGREESGAACRSAVRMPLIAHRAPPEMRSSRPLACATLLRLFPFRSHQHATPTSAARGPGSGSPFSYHRTTMRKRVSQRLQHGGANADTMATGSCGAGAAVPRFGRWSAAPPLWIGAGLLLFLLSLCGPSPPLSSPPSVFFASGASWSSPSGGTFMDGPGLTVRALNVSTVRVNGTDAAEMFRSMEQRFERQQKQIDGKGCASRSSQQPTPALARSSLPRSRSSPPRSSSCKQR